MDMSWYKGNISSEQVVSNGLDILKVQFNALCSRSNCGDCMAIFRAVHSQDAHKGVEIFFSPACSHNAKGLIEYYEGQPCACPDMTDLDLLVGDEPYVEKLYANPGQ